MRSFELMHNFNIEPILLKTHFLADFDKFNAFKNILALIHDQNVRKMLVIDGSEDQLREARRELGIVKL